MKENKTKGRKREAVADENPVTPISMHPFFCSNVAPHFTLPCSDTYRSIQFPSFRANSS